MMLERIQLILLWNNMTSYLREVIRNQCVMFSAPFSVERTGPKHMSMTSGYLLALEFGGSEWELSRLPGLLAACNEAKEFSYSYYARYSVTLVYSILLFCICLFYKLLVLLSLHSHSGMRCKLFTANSWKLTKDYSSFELERASLSCYHVQASFNWSRQQRKTQLEDLFTRPVSSKLKFNKPMMSRRWNRPFSFLHCPGLYVPSLL